MRAVRPCGPNENEGVAQATRFITKGPRDVKLQAGMPICQLIVELVDGTPEKGLRGQILDPGANQSIMTSAGMRRRPAGSRCSGMVGKRARSTTRRAACLTAWTLCWHVAGLRALRDANVLEQKCGRTSVCESVFGEHGLPGNEVRCPGFISVFFSKSVSPEQSVEALSRFRGLLPL
jgi:hypothetical protein